MLLHCERLTKDYGRQRALDGLSIQVGAGEIFGLLGPNGSGKSTALRLFMGFLRPTAGTASIAGHDCWQASVAARRHVGYLPGELRLYENMTGQQLVGFLSRLRGSKADGRVDDLARQFDIDLRRPIASLSSGMKRKVALLTVLSHPAPLLILDEPTNTLDPAMREELLGQLRQARHRGQAVIFSSHVLQEVEQVCDRVAILNRGRLVHLQVMAELSQTRVFQISFATSPPPLPGLAGIRERARSHDGLVLEQTGSPTPLLRWLATLDVKDLTTRPVGLSAIYQRFHGAVP